MKLLLKFLVFSGLIYATVGCVTQAHRYDLHQEIRACQSSCQQRLPPCQVTCRDDALCEKQAKLEAQKKYKKYEHGRCVEGKTIIRRLQSYDDPLQCRKMSCDCLADFRMCSEACAGVIHKQLAVSRMG